MNGKNYKAVGEIETPYRRARQMTDERIGSARVQAFSWRIATFISMGLSALLGAGLIYQSSKAQVVPYIVELSADSQVRLVGTPLTDEWKPSQTLRRTVVERFLKNVRELSTDSEVVRRSWLEAYSVVTPVSKAQLDQFAEDSKPFEKLGEESHVIEVTSVTAPSKDSLRVEWAEDTILKSGYTDRTDKFVGLFTISYKKPQNKNEINRNPLGIFIEHFSFSKVHEHGGSR